MTARGHAHAKHFPKFKSKEHPVRQPPKYLRPGPGNVFAIKGPNGVVELPSIRTTRRRVIKDFVKTETMPWRWWARHGYSVVPMTLRAARNR